jgi:tetratricopeptide (TPR) repeat protein
VGTYTQALSEAVAAFQHGVQTSRELGRIRLGNMPGMDAPTVEIHKHLTGALLCNRSACWRRLGNAWRAVADAEAAIETFVEWGTCHARLGEALEACGDLAAALRSYRRAVAFSPGVPEFQQRLDALLLCVLGIESLPPGAHAGGAGALANPEARWVAAGGGPPRLWLELRAASCCVSLDLGESLWRATDALAFSDVGTFYAEQQQFVEAALGVVASNAGFAMLEGVLEAGIEHFDKSRKAFVALAVGNIFAWVGDYDAAASFFGRAIEAVECGVRRAPEAWLGSLLCNRALCRLRGGDASGAAEDAERALCYRPEWPRAHARAGDCAAEGGDWAAAAAHYAAALKLCVPGSADAMDVNSRLAVASRAGRGAAGALGAPGGAESPLPRSRAASPLPPPGSAGASGGGSARTLQRATSTTSLGEGLDLTSGGEEGDEARVQAALSTYIRNRRRSGKRHTAPAPGAGGDDDADGGATTPGTRTPGGGSMGIGNNGGVSKSPKRSKSGTPEDGTTPSGQRSRSPIGGAAAPGGSGSGGGDATHMHRFAHDVLASFAAMGPGGGASGGAGGAGGNADGRGGNDGAPGGAHSGHNAHGGHGGSSLPPAQLRYDLGGLFSDGMGGHDGFGNLGGSGLGDDVTADFLLDDLVGDPGGYGLR